MKIRVNLVGTTPLLMHNPRMVDPDFELCRQMKPLQAKRKKTDDDLHHIAKLEWYGGLYEKDGVVVQPAAKVKKCLICTARTMKLGKGIERSLVLSDLIVPLEYEGPSEIDKLYADKRFHSRLSVGIGGKRVMRVRPQFFPWALSAEFIFIPDVGMDIDILSKIVELAGSIEGLGDNRVNGYGRFNGSMEVVEQ